MSSGEMTDRLAVIGEPVKEKYQIAALLGKSAEKV